MKPLLTWALALMFVAMVPAWAAAKRVTVSIENLKFKPEETTIEPGDTVVWVNNDDREHRIIAGDKSFKSGSLASGKSYEHTFDQPGKHKYGDELYGRMYGVVIVEKK